MGVENQIHWFALHCYQTWPFKIHPISLYPDIRLPRYLIKLWFLCFYEEGPARRSWRRVEWFSKPENPPWPTCSREFPIFNLTFKSLNTMKPSPQSQGFMYESQMPSAISYQRQQPSEWGYEGRTGKAINCQSLHRSTSQSTTTISPSLLLTPLCMLTSLHTPLLGFAWWCQWESISLRLGPLCELGVLTVIMETPCFDLNLSTLGV